jgi:hypothetical protein
MKERKRKKKEEKGKENSSSSFFFLFFSNIFSFYAFFMFYLLVSLRAFFSLIFPFLLSLKYYPVTRRRKKVTFELGTRYIYIYIGVRKLNKTATTTKKKKINFFFFAVDTAFCVEFESNGTI